MIADITTYQFNNIGKVLAQFLQVVTYLFEQQGVVCF